MFFVQDSKSKASLGYVCVLNVGRVLPFWIQIGLQIQFQLFCTFNLTPLQDLMRMIVDTLLFTHSGGPISALAFISTCTRLHRYGLRSLDVVFDCICLDAWMQPLNDAAYRRMISAIIGGSAEWFESGENFARERCLKNYFSESLSQFGYGMRLPQDHPQYSCSDPDKGQFPDDVVCVHELFFADCELCGGGKYNCHVCGFGAADFPYKERRYCAECLISRRLLLGLRYTVSNEVSPQQGYSRLRVNFNTRVLGWNDEPEKYHDENMAAHIVPEDVRDDCDPSSPGPILLHSCEGDASYYFWFLEMCRNDDEDSLNESD